MTTRETILSRAEALAGFPGQTFPEATPEVIARAGQIAGGTVFFYQHTPVEVGLSGIDWTGKHLNHQEWPAQLNRFFYLSPLVSAYRATGEEQYAAARRGPTSRTGFAAARATTRRPSSGAGTAA